MDDLLVRIGVIALVLGPGTRALADNSPEKAEADARSEYVVKINDACDLALTMTYDGASLRKHDSYVQHDQTDGRRECNEGLRYLWHACRTPDGKAAVKNARIEEIVCRGTAARTSSFALAGGKLTLSRSAADDHAHAHLRKHFEALFRVSLKFGQGADHPDYDKQWEDLRYAPNPTRSTTDYCLVNGKKQEFEEQLAHRLRDDEATLQCWKGGAKVADLKFRAGKKTGFYTQFNGTYDIRLSYRDDQLDGEKRDYRGGKLAEVVMYDRGKIRWSKEFHPNGMIKHYSRNILGGNVGYRQGDDGKIYALGCAPDVGDEVQLRELCGFEGEMTTRIYDGTGKVNRIETWKNGLLQEQSAGDSDYADRSSVDYAAGKKHGIERVLGEDGKLAATVSWKNGVKHGPELVYAEGGTKRTREIHWNAGVRKHATEFYLNGNPKQQEIYAGEERMQLRSYWDTGQLMRLGEMVRCGGSWCEQGVHWTYFENGKAESQSSYDKGRLEGRSRTWWPNGRQATQEEYVGGRRVQSARWDESGTLIAHEAFEADGSRKLQR